MAGYNRNEWKSNNAVHAEEMGMRTASSFAAILKKKAQACDVQAVFEVAAWHHTSARFNETNYFWEPTVEILAKAPAIDDVELRSKLREEVLFALATATDDRDRQTFEELRDTIEDDDAFAKHVAAKRLQLGKVYETARLRVAADKTVETVIANVGYKEFSYSHRQRRYQLIEEVDLRAIPVTIKGNVATFMKDGRQVRKMLNGKAFDIEILEGAVSSTT